MSATAIAIQQLKEMSGKARFVSFTYRNKKANELARHTLIFGANYDKQIKESITALELLMPTFTNALELLAAKELMDSFNETLAQHKIGQFNSAYTKKETYVPICCGMKFYADGGTMNVSGLAHAKVILEPGYYPRVNSRPLTIAKEAIKEQLPVYRWKEFVLTPEHMLKIRLNGEEIVLGD